MMANVKWYLDVDGVVNSIGQPNPKRMPGYERVDVLGYPIWFHPEIIASVNTVAAMPDVEVIWLTTWGRLAVTDLAPAVGLDAFRALPGVEEFFDSHPQRDSSARHGLSSVGPLWWKARLLLEDVGESAALVWTDDDLSKQAKGRVRSQLGSPSLMITPMQRPGLISDHLTRIADFAREHSSGVATG